MRYSNYIYEDGFAYPKDIPDKELIKVLLNDIECLLKDIISMKKDLGFLIEDRESLTIENKLLRQK